MRWLYANPGYKLLALVIALTLWGLSHSSSEQQRSIDIPVVISGIPDDLVVTSKSVDEVNLRVMGSRASLRNLVREDLIYSLELAGAKPGRMAVDIDAAVLELPRGAKVVSRSPSRVELTLAPRGSRAVEIRVDVEGEPAEGHRIASVEVDPPRVRITGARSEVLRLSAVVTETVDVTGADEDLEKEVRLSLGASNVWLEEPVRIQIRIRIVPEQGDRETA